MIQDVESSERQSRAHLMLELVLQGDQDFGRGAVLSDEEADRRFREKLEALRREAESAPGPRTLSPRPGRR